MSSSSVSGAPSDSTQQQPPSAEGNSIYFYCAIEVWLAVYAVALCLCVCVSGTKNIFRNSNEVTLTWVLNAVGLG